MLSIELNDTGILAVGEGGGALVPNPGYALLDGNSVVVGREAARRARLSPRRVHDRFWEQLDTAPLGRPHPGHLSTADLAHAHLTQVWRESGEGVDTVLLVIPGRFSTPQLGLILGIARACGIPVAGMVDASVAAAAGRGFDGDVVVLDLQLHAAVVSLLAMEGGPVRRDVTVDDGTGVFPLIDAVARHAAALFLRTTRFDPLHRAESEQTLYDQLPQWIRDLRRHETIPVAIEAAGRKYEIELARAGVIAAIQRQLDHIVDLVDRECDPEKATVALTHTASQFPGLARRLRHAKTVESLPIAAAAVGALDHAPSIVSPGESLPFVTRLTDGAPLHPTVDGEPRSADGDRPTHLLHDGRALSIDDRPLVIGVDPPVAERHLVLTGNTAGVSRSHCRFFVRDGHVELEDHSTYGTFVNGRRIERSEVVSAGDVVRVGTPGIELQLIVVADSDGSA